MEIPTRSATACPVHADFDPLSPAFLADPFAFLTSLQHEAPVFYAPAIGYYVVTRYADIEVVFLDHETYSAAPAQLPLVPLQREIAEILRVAGTAPQPSEPDTFDPRRTGASRTLTFGKGIHYCLGAALGKLEAQLALEALTRRFPNLRLVEGQALKFPVNLSFRGPRELWVRAK